MKIIKFAVEIRETATDWQSLLWTVIPRKVGPSVVPVVGDTGIWGGDAKLPCQPCFRARLFCASMPTHNVPGEAIPGKTVTFLCDW